MRNARLAVLAAALLALCRTAALGAAAPRTLQGHVPPQVRSAARLARVDPAENVELSLVVAVDQDLMARTLDGIYGPHGSRKPLSPAEFAGAFGLAAKRQALKDFAAANGLTVDPAADDPRSLVVKVSGPARLVEKAFGLRLNRYRAADGQVFRAHETDPVIPGELAPHLRAVMGLSNFRGAHKARLRVAGRVGTATGSTYPGTGPGNSLSPTDIKSIYGLTLPLTGSGQKVALLELDGYDPADVAIYKATFSLTNTPVTYVGIDSQANLCGPSQNLTCNGTTAASDPGMTEVALDIDMVLAVSAGISELRVYTAPNTGQGLIDAYNQMAVDNSAKSISTSWGLDEKDSGGAFMAAEASIFQQMAANGQTIFAASGDGGAYDNDGASTPLIVVTDDPASQPYVSGVGGTSLRGTIASHSEVVWNNGCASPGTNCRANGAGGGGIANYCEDSLGNQTTCPGSAQYFSLPSWQSGVSGSASQSFRNVPDVALNADPATFPYGVEVGGSFYYVGGTSAAAPLWGGLTALINQKRATNGYGSLGFANPLFYQLGTGSSYSTYFNDVTSGSNGAYSAGSGYDNASGWGSFKADALINILGAPLAPASAVTNLSAVTLGVSSISYTWSSVPTATGYDIYYATNSSQALATAVAQTAFTQTGLIGNETSGIFVFAENQGTEGPGAFLTTATYASAPGSPAVASGFTSSATFTYSACPAFPANGSCSGYLIEASTASNFSGTIFSTSTPNRALTTLSFPPGTLASLTGYYMRLGYLNPKGAPTFDGFGSTFNTGSNLVAPTNPFFDQITASSIRFSWSQSSNPGGTQYSAQASTASDFSGTLLTLQGTSLQETFSGLTADTSYFFRVQGLGGPYLLAGPQATLAAAPALSTNSFPVVGAGGVTLAWSGANDQPDTLYQADVSADPAFLSGVTTAMVRSSTAALSGLVANTLYYARVSAVGRQGGVVGPLALGSTTTLVLTPTLPGQPFSGQGQNGFSFTFNSGNPAGTRYLVRVSTDSAFSAIRASSNTAATTASFAGLLSNQVYYVEAAALNQSSSPTPFTAAVSTYTQPAAPLAAAVPVTTFTATTFGLAWTAGTLAPGTTYLAQVSSSPSFGFAAAVQPSSITVNAFATLTALQPNTTYYGRVQAVSFSTNPSGPFLQPAATIATLPNPPLAAASAFLAVTYTSATVAWKALPLAPSSATAEGYVVEFATSPAFTTIFASSAVGPAASTATVSGLAFSTPYFARVGAVGWEGAVNYLVLGSTTTALPPLSSGTVTTSGLTLSMPRAFTELTSISVFVPPGAFPAGTQVSVLSTLGSAISGARSNESASLTPFGPAVGIDLSAGGLQPAVPVRVTIGYDPTKIPAGVAEKQLLLWRYDTQSGQWTLVPSQVDATAHVLTAYTPHFSTFAPFFAAAGTDVDAVQVFPQPWEIGDASSQYWSSVLSFTGLPASADVKIFTIVGELVWSGTASASGVLTWNGNNRFGRRAASGTYYATFQSGGKTKVRRVVIIR